MTIMLHWVSRFPNGKLINIMLLFKHFVIFFSLPWFMVLILIMAAFVFFFRFLRTFFNVMKYRQIHAFYIEALKIPSVSYDGSRNYTISQIC